MGAFFRKKAQKWGLSQIFLQNHDINLLTDKELVYILHNIKMKWAIRFDASAAIDEVLKEGI